MEKEEKKEVEAAPAAKKTCQCGDLKVFLIALLTSLIVVAGYHIGRQAMRCFIRCSAARQQIQAGPCAPCPCPCKCRMCKFRVPPRCVPGKPGFDKPGFPGKPGMGKPGFHGKRGRFGKGKPMPPKCDPKPECAPEVKPAAPAAPAPEAKPAAPAAK